MHSDGQHPNDIATFGFVGLCDLDVSTLTNQIG
jgi:hypothetical protein